MKRLLTLTVIALALPALAQNSFNATITISPAPTTNSIPVSEWGRQASVVTRTIDFGTNVFETTWTNFTGLIDASPYGNTALTLTLEYPWLVQGETNDWPTIAVHFWGSNSGGSFDKTDEILMTPGSRSAQWFFSFSASTDTPPVPHINGDTIDMSGNWYFPPHDWWTIGDIFPYNGPPSPVPYPQLIFYPPVVIQGDGNHFRLGVPGAGFASYHIQSNTNLATTNWVTLTNLTTGADGALSFEWPISTNVPQMFYRPVLDY